MGRNPQGGKGEFPGSFLRDRALRCSHCRRIGLSDRSSALAGGCRRRFCPARDRA
ncbi:hypothetical protein [Pelobacter propionicus]|uniref:hypothetical protein n=1 Tax=Pelobacter propionicus TaxID=29543 RepID=UPI0012EDF8F3|nr:hypothetical protein [Pelobacter propionicus]